MPSAQQRALISPTRIDFPTQRLIATLIFVSLQSYKVYHLVAASLISHSYAYSGLFWKWMLYDCIYIFALYVARIPWLQFSILKSIFLVSLLWSVDMCMFVGPAVSLCFYFSLQCDSFGKQLGVSSGKLVNVRDVLFDPSRILGKHSVHILPYGTAKLNPDDHAYCLPGSDALANGHSGIYMPIIMNDTTPKKITVSHVDLETLKTSTFAFSGDKIQRATEIGQSKRGIESFFIHITKPGVYQLKSIVSKDGEKVRIKQHQAFVFTCPMASFVPVPSNDLCLGDKQPLQLQVTGVPPLKVEYTRHTGSLATMLKLDHIQPAQDVNDSPLNHLPGGLQDADPSFFIPSTNATYEWASRQSMSIQLNLTFDQALDYAYGLTRVTDGAGNIVDLSSLPAEQFHIHSHPAAQFSCQQHDPVRLLIGQNGTYLPVKLQGAGPVTVVYQRHDTDKKKPKKLMFQNDGLQHIPVTSIGDYRLVSVHDQFCPGKVLSPDNCLVVQPPLPSVIMEATPIPSKCAKGSEVGMRFSVDFSGSPPYTLKYLVKKGRRKEIVDQRQIVSDHSHHSFTYLPTSSGDYTYEFTSLTDAYYTEKSKLSTVHQVVHPQPDAHFVNAVAKRACLGEDTRLQIKLQGTPPYKLTWMYNKQLYTNETASDDFAIDLPAFDKPGRHIVALKKIEDANGCTKDLTTSDAVIDVRRDRPTAMFYTDNQEEKTLLVAQGATAKLPLRLTGEGPWQITYRNLNDPEGKNQSKVLYDPNAHLAVDKRGRYELLTVQDTMCGGHVLPPDYIVEWMARPTLQFADPVDQVQLLAGKTSQYKRHGVCQGMDDGVDLLFDGHGPFTCRYETFHVAESTSISLGKDELTTGLVRTRLGLTTDKPGKYRYVFQRLADQQYPDPFQPTQLLELEQEVYGSPTLRFANPDAKVQMCVDEPLTSDSKLIYLQASGQAPFTVQVRVHHLGNPGRNAPLETMHVADSTYFPLDIPTVLESSGKYQIDLVQIQDANGCTTNVAGQPGSSMIVDALDIATITPLGACGHVCVGDSLEYSLSGDGPFVIDYDFNGRVSHIKSASNKLSLLADRSGNLTIVSVGNQRNQCQSKPKYLSSQIHPVPSSLVSDGKDLLENIQEGEVVQAVVKLHGTPPFDFEWQRSELIFDHAKKHHYKGNVLESHVVHGVQEHEYHISTSTEGIIEVVSIKDRYCQYPRA
ncbi:hypothetical protein DM01DRAFT_1282670 [Hesseltinella vesiculosa]|uniref:Nucleoporin Pom152 n=1 Tax=Hesseltinella vesiculosa TaxID=101127 RepID=A0A1X2GR61_9FUNG|nr:hypothetical protein DM01DRAFT_1282670 [Hesseltinella vesiculosa]